MRNDYCEEGSGASPFLWFLGGLGVGALFMYLTDPDNGRRRRALIRDQYDHATRAVREGAEGMVRDVTNRASGMLTKARVHLEEHQAQRNPGPESST
jgi:ribosomal protein S17E